MAGHNGQAAPAPHANHANGDGNFDIENETVQVWATQAFYGSTEVKLANARIKFTYVKTVSGLEPAITFTIKRASGESCIVRITHFCMEGIAFLKPDPSNNISAAVSFSCGLGASLYMQESKQEGLLHRAITDRNVHEVYSDYEGEGERVPSQLCFILKPWRSKTNDYMWRGLTKLLSLGSFEEFIDTCTEFASVRKRDIDAFPIDKIAFERNKAPQPTYCAYFSLTEWITYIDCMGVALSEELNKDGFRYYMTKEEDLVVPEEIPDMTRVSLATKGMVRVSPSKASTAKTVAYRTLPQQQQHQHLQQTPQSQQQQQRPRILDKRSVVAARKQLPPTQATAPKAALPAHDTVVIITNPKARKNNASVASEATVSTQVPSTSTQSETKKTVDADKPVKVEEEELDETSQDVTTASTSSTKSNDSSPNTPSAPSTSAASPRAMQLLSTPAECATTLAKYPPNASESETITIKFKDMERLAHMEMLNDIIVEFGVRYILYDLNKEKKDRIHPMSTYFFSSFAANAPNDKNGGVFTPNNVEKRKALLAKNFVKMRRWTRKVDIFDKDFIVIPVNNELHWYLIIVAYPGRALRKKDEPEGEAPTNPEEMCQVYVFDSLPDYEDPKRCCCFPIMRDYLRLEFEDKKAKKDTTLRFSEKHVCSIRVKNLPLQTNLADCGVYLIAYLEAFLANVPTIGEDKILDVEKWLPYMRLLYLEFYRDKLIARIRQNATKSLWHTFADHEIRNFQRNKDAPRITVLREADIVDFARRPRRHECYSCPDNIKPEIKRPRSASLPPPGVLVPPVERSKHKHV